MNRTWWIVAVALIVLGMLGVVFAGVVFLGGTSGLTCPNGELCFGGPQGNAPDTTPDTTPGTPRGTVPSARGVDAMFIINMIPHHEDAIAMAELALTRAEHPELKQLAENVIETQSAEIDLMRGWYRDWYGEDVPDAGSGFMGRGMMGGGGMRFGTQDLENAADFDKAFIEEMVPHHAMGVMMARMAASSASTTEIRDLAADIIRTQTDEIDQMETWYREWYGN